MKKVKISELPLYNSLKGLFTIGTDALNRSVKVSLEFIETSAKAADDAAADAKAATKSATTATSNANTAADNAKTATAQAQTATKEANAATEKANASSSKADASAKAADEATAKAQTATQNADEATRRANESADNADRAADNALSVKDDIQATLDRLVPTGLTVSAPERLTLGNPKASIKYSLTPSDALPNVIILCDHKALDVDPLTGQLYPLAKGKSRVRVIPTCNVQLAKTVVIEVGEPTLRLQTLKALRLTSGGALRLN